MIVRRRDGAIVRQLRTLYNIGTIGDLTDGQLLERFATDADEVAELAFSALVERHETLVWRVCLSIVRDEHEAEDAFQATFLVLVNKARSLWVRDSLGPWLHQVACRTASHLRTTGIRRRKHERLCAQNDGAREVGLGTPLDVDLAAAVHEELNQLPEKYRAPLVLCDLEGRTHQEVARFLGWPIGTVKSRQSKGRGLIRERLVRRGLGLAVAGTAFTSLRQTAVAATPKAVSRTTVNAAMQQSARLVTGIGGFGARAFAYRRSSSSHVVDQTSVAHGCYPCRRDCVRRGGSLRTWLTGAGAAGQTAGPEAASEHEWTDSTATRSESGDGQAGDRHAAAANAA